MEEEEEAAIIRPHIHTLLRSRQGQKRRERIGTPFVHEISRSPNRMGQLKKKHVLESHLGCVNTVMWNYDGTKIISGSDDKFVKIWCPYRGKLLESWRPGHAANIFSAQFLPRTNDEYVASCSADGLVCLSNVPKANDGGCKEYRCHNHMVNKVGLVDPFCWLSCSEDGTVRSFDRREPHDCYARRVGNSACKNNVLVHIKNKRGSSVGIASLSMNPLDSTYFVIGCSDPVVRLYDRRMLGCGIKAEPIARYVGIQSKKSDFSWRGLHVTSVAFSKNGREVVASYSGSAVVLFNLEGDQQEPEQESELPEFELGDTDSEDDSEGDSSEYSDSISADEGEFDEEDNESEDGGERGLEDEGTGEGESRSNEGETVEKGEGKGDEENLGGDSEKPEVGGVEGEEGDEEGGKKDASMADEEEGEGSKREEKEKEEQEEAEIATEKKKEKEERGKEKEEKKKEKEERKKEKEEKKLEKDRERREEEKKEFYSFLDEEKERQKNVPSPVSFSSSSSSGPGPACPSFPDVPLPTKRGWTQKFFGHTNMRTVKECNFFGVNDEYVLSGSDDGTIFIWDKQTGKAVQILKGDTDVVNCVQGHPCGYPILVTSGIEDNVKVWYPMDEVKFSPKLEKVNSTDWASKPYLNPLISFMLQREQLLAGMDDSSGDSGDENDECVIS